MTTLCINIDHVATLREARKADEPDPVPAAAACEAAGAAGITIHLREDRRHIQDRDLERLRTAVRTPLNLEMAATEEMVAIALLRRPDQVTLVPENRLEVTTEGGLEVAAAADRLRAVVQTLQDAGIPVSLFIDPVPAQVDAAARTGARLIELHTGRYAEADSPAARIAALDALQAAAARALALGLVVNAGHGLDYDNVGPVAAIPGMHELNIGHSIISRAVFTGLDRAVRDMLVLVRTASAPGLPRP